MNHSRLHLVVLLFVTISMVSCISSKKVVYFNNLTDTTSGALRFAQADFETPIQKNDLLSIAIGGSNPEDLATLNSANGVVPGATSSAKGVGYLVEADGKIQLPFLGKVQAEGLTRVQLQDKLTMLFKDYTKNPVVNVKFSNYGFSVLGEVTTPGRFEMENERTTILEALAKASDITTFGQRDNILVIREVNGKREFGRIDLLSKDVFKSPYFYLKTNDVVYVEPVKAKFLSRSGTPQYIGIAAGAIALILTLFNFVKL